MATKFVVLFALLTVALCHAESDKRPKTHTDKLSEAEHFDKEGEHNPDYDHEAFLGTEKEEFDHLPPEEAKKRLRALIREVDNNKDGAVTTEELTDWVKGVFKKRSMEGVDNDLKEKDANEDGKVDWNEYSKGTYGDQTEDDEEMKEFLRRDKRRFDAADTNKDGFLTREEMAIFLHPESSPEMSEVHILETIEGKRYFIGRTLSYKDC
ncbi:predicted protein [Nematostella vectensis]|uniref:Reticulocalbin-3 n=1 Tax=Nematostella vectensis TaxID=45351 RepID=A7T654_NEMVE|nr:predicted protein [Nematostella vectensis]|eukprot:XP_001620654.1 hypothetical protein NEMVEDRAFT_v1g147476 [Nematostella vectensis]